MRRLAEFRRPRMIFLASLISRLPVYLTFCIFEFLIDASTSCTSTSSFMNHVCKLLLMLKTGWGVERIWWEERERGKKWKENKEWITQGQWLWRSWQNGRFWHQMTRVRIHVPYFNREIFYSVTSIEKTKRGREWSIEWLRYKTHKKN